MKVPRDVQAALGQKVLSRSLRTQHLRQAQQESKAVRSEWKTLIKAARQGVDPVAIRESVERWKLGHDLDPPGRENRSDILSRWGLQPVGSEFKLSRGVDIGLAPSAIQGLAALAKALRQSLDGGEPVEGVSGLLASLKLPDTPEARARIATAILEIEGVRLFKGEAAHRAEVAQAALDRASETQVRGRALQQAAFGEVQPIRSLPAQTRLTGHTLSQLYAHWMMHHPMPAKARGKHDNYVKRLREFMAGDVDIALVTKVKAGDFWLAVKRLPARRNAAALAGMEFSQLVATGLPPMGDAALFQWALFFRRLFNHAVRYDFINVNPFDVVEVKRDRSELEGEAYSDEEIRRFFSLPLFTGHAGDYDRVQAGAQVLKDWKYWLPILSLWTGTRLNEWAAAHGSEIVEHGEGWFLDLSERPVGGDAPNRVKTKAARRLVPIHPALIGLGFLEIVGAGPLFPDLHDHKLNPAARAANWFTRHRNKVPWNKTLHELRHTWKNAARSAGVSEEISDLISAHVSGSIGRKYGVGVKPEILTSAVRMIDYPTFPLIVTPSV